MYIFINGCIYVNCIDNKMITDTSKNEFMLDADNWRMVFKFWHMNEKKKQMRKMIIWYLVAF